MLKKIKTFMQILIGSTFGVYLGTVIWEIVDHNRKAQLNIAMSAPWYTRIIVVSVFMGILLLIELIVFLCIRYKLKKTSSTVRLEEN